MTASPAFLSKEEQLQRLTNELAVVKDALRDMSATVGRIERHVKRSFDAPAQPRQSPAPRKRKAAAKPATPPRVAITPAEARALFDDLAALYKREGPATAQERLQKMSASELTAIARELGIAPRSRSKKALQQGIAYRLTERAMLTSNVNVTPSRRERMANARSA